MGAYRARGLTNGFLPEEAFLHLDPTAIGYVELDEPLSTAGLKPVLDDDEWARRRDRLRSALDHES